MSMNDRFLVERMFKEHYVSVICTTTTLALGVNLPAHLVIIKGTTFFKSGRREDLPLSEVAQMSGRAGRPGLDTHGVALVLTTEDKAALYEPLRHGDSCTTVESRLHQKMVEHVNAEVALRTIHSFALGVEWIKTTFLWIRLRRCPRHYGILFSTKEEESDFDREEFAAHLMRRMLVELEKQGCITIHQDGAHVGDGRDLDSGAAVDMKKGNYVVESTRVGRAMARRYVLLKTVELFNAETARVRSQKDIVAVTAQEGAAVPPKEGKTLEEMAGSANPFTLQQLLCILSRSTEFEDLHLRLGDRKHLNEINKIVRLPLKSGMRGGREVREDWHKVYVLIQAHLEHTQINDFSLRNDSVRLWSTVPRLARFLVDYAGSLDSYSFMKESSLLQRCIEQRMWWDGPVLKQLDGVGENAAKALMRCGIRSLADVAKTDPRKLESLCSRNPPFGNDLQDRCLALPQWALRLERCESSEMLRAVVTQTTGMDKLRASQTKYNMVLVVGNTATDSILLFRQFGSLEAKEKPLVFTFQISRTRRCRVVGCVFTEHQLLGTDANATLAVGEDGEKAEDDVNFTLAVDEDREKTEEAAHMRVEPLKKERKSVGPNTSTSAFDALTRDLRWVAGTSLRRAADAPNSLLLKNHGHFQRETQPTVDVLGDEFTTDNLEHERSSSKEAGAMVGGSSPDAATLVHSCGVDNTMTQMDEDYMQLVNRTADIASSLRLGRNSPAYSCKRSRENVSNDSSASRLRLMSEYANRQEGFAPASNTGKTVMLRKAVSPDPPVAPRSTATTAAAAAAAITTNHPCPSTRFRFSVRGAAFQPVQHDQIQRNPLPPPLQQKPPIEAMNDHQFSAVGGNAAFLVPRGAFPGTCFQPPWRVTLPYDFPLPTCTYDISSRVCAQPPQLPTNFGIPVPHHGGAMEVHPAWHRGAFTAAQSSGLRAWCPPSAATEPGTHWAPAPVRHGYVALNESRAPSTAEQFHGTYPTAPTVSDHYAVSNSRSAGVVPRATTVRKGWW
ncbi:RNA helicase [Trypanosoma grayi]|uniref:RNA helicase n=1 Tax=Trypanosoma grayi TaxID=71804 RepID=UPI0004F4B346|nr:RNA helicase [Trypanosoma grayi]KEG07272.1 RNA helicase [Trypanosoma grayi]